MTMWFLSYAAGQLSRFLTNPGPTHYAAAIRVLVYLRDQGCRSLVFASNRDRGLDTFVDSSWGTRFSVSGCLVFFHGCLFHWFSKMKKSVVMSLIRIVFATLLAANYESVLCFLTSTLANELSD